MNTFIIVCLIGAVAAQVRVSHNYFILNYYNVRLLLLILLVNKVFT